MRRLLILGGLLGAGTTWAQDRLRHEYVPPEVLRRLVTTGAGSAQIEGGDPVPDAVRRDGARLEKPGAPDPEAPTFRPAEDPRAKDDGSIPRPREAHPDRKTTQDQALTYHAIYNPTVAPLRRNVAFDRVHSDYRVSIAPGPLRPATMAPRAPVPGREMFWGDIKLRVGAGPAPLPSVAPDMRILAVRVEPEIAVRFTKDAADNFYVEAAHDGLLRLVILVDADAAYFSAPLPGNVPLGAQAGQPGTELPRTIASEAKAVLARIGVSRDQPFDQGVARLVAYFRDFAAGDPPEPKGSIYTDLAFGQKGVCRHRSFAFIITARAAGVPTRQVQNEAHAFVEILAPDGHWRRVDLGGQAPSLDIKNGENRRLHRPPADPFPKPDRYLEQYSGALAGDGPANPGPDAPQITGAPSPLGGGVAGEGPAQGGPEGPAGPMSGGGDGPPAEVPLPPAFDDPLDADSPGPESSAKPVQLALDRAAELHEAWRGEALPSPITGVLRDAAGGGVNGVKVQLYVLPEAGGPPRPIGRAVPTNEDGRFSAPVRLPATLPLGEYRVVAASAGDAAYAPARSDD